MITFRDSFGELLYRVATRLRTGALSPRSYRRDLILAWIARRS